MRRIWPLMMAGFIVVLVTVLTRDAEAGAGTPASAVISQSYEGVALSHTLSFFGYWLLTMPLGAGYWFSRPGIYLTLLLNSSYASGCTLRAAPRDRRGCRGSDCRSGGMVRAVACCRTVPGRYGVHFGHGITVIAVPTIEVCLGAWMLVPLPVLMYVNYSPKYLLLCAPATAILVVEWMRAYGPVLRVSILAALVIMGMALSAAIIRVDARMATLDRRAAEELIAPQVLAGRSVWFVGHWGFHWYATLAGAQPITVNGPLPSAGDLVVRSFSSGSQALRLLPNRQLLAWYWQDTTARSQIMSRPARAGFYADWWGPFPIGHARDDSSGAQVWRVAAYAGPRLTLDDVFPKVRWK